MSALAWVELVIGLMIGISGSVYHLRRARMEGTLGVYLAVRGTLHYDVVYTHDRGTTFNNS